MLFRFGGGWGISFLIFAKQIAKLHYSCFAKIFGHRSKTAHCAVFSLRSNPIIFSVTKKDSTLLGAIFLCGGERGIRTLGTVLAFTRFPIVRLRPAQPSLHLLDFYIISQKNKKSSPFWKKYLLFSIIFSKNLKIFSKNSWHLLFVVL